MGSVREEEVVFDEESEMSFDPNATQDAISEQKPSEEEKRKSIQMVIE